MLVVIVLLSRCGERSFEDSCPPMDHSEKNLELRELRIDIPLAGGSYTWNHMDTYSNDERTLIYGLDPFKNEIQIIDLQSKEIHRTIELYDNGPNEIIDPHSILVKSPDSIYLMNLDMTSTLYLIDKDARKNGQWRINYELPRLPSLKNAPDVLLWGIGLADQQFFVENNVLTALCDFGSYEDDYYTPKYKRPIMASVDLISESFISFMYSFPTIYETAPRIPHNQYNKMAKKGNDYLVSFESNAQILDTKNNKFVCIKSKYWRGLVTLFERGKKFDVSKESDAFAYDDSYEGIHYDNTLEIGYRIFKTGDSNRIISRQKSSWSIILFDKNLGKIGETNLFDTGEYNFSLVTLIEGQGLLVSRENFTYEKNKEEVLSFSLFHPSSFIVSNSN